jgi:hypothetical protein
MRRTVLLALVAAAALGCASLALGQSPHVMTKEDGSLDEGACAFCHEDDLTLSRSKLDTCTLCHAEAAHSGAREHVRASAASVARATAQRGEEDVSLPLAEDGRMYCGTCHLFHDPKVLSEDWLAKGWKPAATGLAGAVRQSVLERWPRLAEMHGEKELGAKFAAEGTTLLRLPVDDGSLCRQCHQALP